MPQEQSAGIESREAPAVDLLIRNGFLVTMDGERRVLPHGSVGIAGGRIVSIGPDAEVAADTSNAQTIDAGGGVVHPGLIDSHMHVAHHVLRAAESDTMPYAEQAAFHTEFWDLAREDDEYAGAALACLEMARNGTTYFFEAGTVLEPDSAAAAAEAVGMRASLADPFLWDVGGYSPDVPSLKRAPPDLKRALNLLGTELKRNTAADSLVRGHVAIVGMGACSDELELAAKACADENGVVLTRHQSYNRDDTGMDDERFGRHPLLHYADLGTLGPTCTFAHMNFVRPDEIDAILDSGLSIVWCPSASMLFGLGATIRGTHLELYDRGVNIALGCDAINSALSFDLGLQGFLAVLTAREKTEQRDALMAEDVMEMMTLNGAQAIGETGRLGSLEVGKCADLVIRRTDLPESQPVTDPIQSLVYGALSKSVDTVIVNGEIIVRDGHSTRVDEAAIYARAGESAARVLSGISRFTPPRWRPTPRQARRP